MKLYRTLSTAIFLVAVSLRLLLCWENPPSNSFDDHFEPISLIMQTGSIPDKDACFQCYQPPVFYYTSAKLGSVVAGLGGSDGAVGKCLQFTSCSYNILTLAFLFLILQRLPVSTFARIVAFGTVCFLPRHIYAAAMHSNDNLAGLMVGISGYLVLVCIDRKLAWQPIALLGVALPLAILVKYTAFVVLPVALFGLAVLCLREPSVPVVRRASAFAAAIVPAVLVLGIYTATNYRDYGSPLPWNAGIFDTSLRHPRDPEPMSFSSFTPWLYVENPLILPGQMHSFWTLIHSGAWFDTEPKFIHVTDRDNTWWPRYFGWLAGELPPPPLPTPLSGFTRAEGGLLVAGGLVPLFLVGAGCTIGCRRISREGLSNGTLKLGVLAVLLAANIAGIILLTMRAPVYSSVKAVYLLNSLPAFAFFMALAIDSLAKRRCVKTAVATVSAALSATVVLHIVQIAAAFHQIQGKY